MPAARTDVSTDGRALVVHRFDVDDAGQPHWGLEDFCVLLGLRPAAKYETTWERIAKAVRNHVPGSDRQDAFTQMASLLLLTYALRNADCHAKNLALRYTSRRDVHLAPAFDMITTAAYPDYAKNPPAISFMGRKTWDPGKAIQTFITATFGVPLREQASIVERIGDAMSDVAPRIREAMRVHPAFEPIGARMLFAWNEGLSALSSPRTYALETLNLGDALSGLSEPPPAQATRTVIGRSDLLGQ